MARGNRPGPKRRGRAFRAFEHCVLGIGMSFIAFFIERRLLKALKQGHVEPAPRTAADGEETPGDLVSEPAEGELATAPHEIRDQSDR